MTSMPASRKATAIVGAALALFLRHGIRRVSVEEICREAGASKRTFYKYFRNRDELAIAVLSKLIDESTRSIEATLASDKPIETKAREIIELKARMAAKTSAEFYNEVMTADSELGRFAREKQRQWDERVRAFYAAAQARGEIRKDVNVDFLMFMLIRARQLVEDEELQRLQPDFAQLVEWVMKLFFYGIVPRPESVRRQRSKP